MEVWVSDCLPRRLQQALPQVSTLEPGSAPVLLEAVPRRRAPRRLQERMWGPECPSPLRELVALRSLALQVTQTVQPTS
jgi:hypothetical protein